MGVDQLIRVTCPFDLLKEKYIDMVIDHRLNLEIGLNGAILDTYSDDDFRRMSDLLSRHNLLVTVHGPFTDLPLGSVQSSIRKTVISIQKRAIDIAEILKAPQIVMHTGFDPKHHGTPDDSWIKRLKYSLLELLDYAKRRADGPDIALENTFEFDPTLHEAIFSQVKHEALGFCFDLAHQVVFSRSTMERWLNGPCGERLKELHLHDNHGESDEHLAVGQGCLDFNALFNWITTHGKRPVLTIEAHNERAVLPSLENVTRLADKWGV